LIKEERCRNARRREIDVVLVWRLDRWGRSVTDLLATLQELEHLGVGFVSLTEALDLTTLAGRAMAGLLAVFAAFEREILGERTRAGLAHARQNGKRLGRPATVAAHAVEFRRLHRAGVAKAEIARRLRVGPHFSTPNPGRFLPEIGPLAFFARAYRKKHTDPTSSDRVRRVHSLWFPDATISGPAAHRHFGRHRHDESSDAARQRLLGRSTRGTHRRLDADWTHIPLNRWRWAVVG
jgi:hypothetical protein